MKGASSNGPRVAIAVVAGATAWFASLGVHGAWPLAWLVPLPLLLLAPDLTGRTTVIAAFVTAFLGSLNLLAAYADVPLSVTATMLLGTSLQFAVVLGCWRLVARRTWPRLAALAYPLILTSTEYLVSLVSPHGTAGNTAYSQTAVLPLLQLASVTGLWGIGFLLAWVPAGVAMAWRSRRDARVSRNVLLSVANPLLAAILFGFVRLRGESAATPVAVGLFAHDGLLAHANATSLEDVLPVLDAALGAVRTVAAEGVSVVVLPEKLLPESPRTARAVNAALGRVAAENQVYVVAGLDHREAESAPAEPSRSNLAVLYTPDGQALATYTKQHLVPGVESAYVAGANDSVGPLLETTVGIAICKDLDFVDLGRRYSRAGTGLMLVPAWDFGADGWLHSRMAIMRAVEGGYALVRSASMGQLTVSDREGRVIAETASQASEGMTLTARVRPGDRQTPYSRFGDWFAWLTLAGALAVAVKATRWPV